VQLGAWRRQRLALERGTEHEVLRCGELDDGRRALRLEPREPHGALQARQLRRSDHGAPVAGEIRFYYRKFINVS
jgi:hypothetical protein